MNTYTLTTFVHVAAAVALLSGSVVGSPAIRRAVRRARTTEDVRAFLAVGRPLLVLEPVSAFVVLASGIYLTSLANFWGQGWVLVAAASWMMNTIVAAAVVKPALKLLAAEAATADGAVGPALDAARRSRRWSFGGGVLMASDAAMLYLMTMQPGLTASLAVVAVANLVVAGSRALQDREVRAGIIIAPSSSR